MKEKLWNLFVDSNREAWLGAGNSMNNAIDTSRECYCELAGIDEEWLIRQVEKCQKDAMAAFDYRIEHQTAIIERFVYNMGELKEIIDALGNAKK